ncbi:MAG: hypothetical protein ACAI44_17655 [Candidatus Sericytochromatia bacterium]
MQSSDQLASGPIVIGELQPLTQPYFQHFSALVELLQQQPQLMLELESESFGHFACTQCGTCCELPWRIEISQSYYEEWFDVFDQHPSGRFKQPFVLKADASPATYAGIRRIAGGTSCIFLEADKSCYIHRHYGEAALSTVCKDFPRLSKIVKNHFVSHQLSHSCEIVPELLATHPGLMYRLKDMGSARPDLSNSDTAHLGRNETYLWLGMALDLLAAPQPETVIARWRLFLPMLEWMEALGIQQVNTRQLTQLYHQLMDQLAFAGLEAPNPDWQRKGLQWGVIFLASHPGSNAWLRELLQHRHWPELSPSERELLDLYLGHYLRSRLLGMPFVDMHIGRMSLWQMHMLLCIQLLVLQCLALYYRAQDAVPLQKEHLQRAINAVSYRFEQVPELIKNLHFKDLSQDQCYSAMEVLLSVDFAATPAWTSPV